MKAAPDSARCRVLTQRTINGRGYLAGEHVELSEPLRGFLIEHAIVALDELEPMKEKRGKRGPAV